jgi:hypothetical protein
VARKRQPCATISQQLCRSLLAYVSCVRSAFEPVSKQDGVREISRRDRASLPPLLFSSISKIALEETSLSPRAKVVENLYALEIDRSIGIKRHKRGFARSLARMRRIIRSNVNRIEARKYYIVVAANWIGNSWRIHADEKNRVSLNCSGVCGVCSGANVRRKRGKKIVR